MCLIITVSKFPDIGRRQQLKFPRNFRTEVNLVDNWIMLYHQKYMAGGLYLIDTQQAS